MKIKQLLHYFTIVDNIGIAQELGRINIYLTKTNRKANELNSALQTELTRQIKLMIKDVKADQYLGLETIKIRYEKKIRALIRVAVQESYLLAINYVGKSIDEPDLFFTETDITNIKSEVSRVEGIFWRNTFDHLESVKLNERMKNMPIGFGAFFDSIVNIVRVVASVATFGTVQKATTEKIQQMPPATTIDPITNVASIKKRIVVFVTKKDSKVCPICRQYEGVEWEEDDPFIIRPIDDTHPNCRCRLLLKEGDSISSG